MWNLFLCIDSAEEVGVSEDNWWRGDGVLLPRPGFSALLTPGCRICFLRVAAASGVRVDDDQNIAESLRIKSR